MHLFILQEFLYTFVYTYIYNIYPVIVVSSGWRNNGTHS